MADLLPMYPGVANSPETFLKEALTIDGTIMYLADGSVLGEIPTLAVIGEGQQAETVLVTSTRSDGGFAITRGVEGPKKAWTKATTVARNWTNKDYETLVDNIKRNDASVSSLRDTLTNQVKYMMFYTDDAVEYKVDKIDGKGLSTNDYDATAKAKVDAIPPDPKYTDTVPDLLPYAKNDDLMQQIADVKSGFEKALELSENNLTEADETLEGRINQVNTAVEEVQQFYVPKNDIIDDLTTGGVDKALSAEQGKTLEKNKLDKTDIVNDLTTGGTDKALSAEQGKTLFTYADNGKKSIADAIVGKGVDATKSDSFGALADKISKIKTGYGVGDVIPEENVKVLKEFVQGQPQKIWEFMGHSDSDWVTALAVGPDGSIYSGSLGDRIYRILPDGQKVWVVEERSALIYSIAVDDGGYVYSAKANEKIFKISPSGNKIWEFTGHSDEVRALAIAPDGLIYSGCKDGKVFKISPGGNKIWEFTGHAGAVRALAVGPDGSIYSGSEDKKVFKISPNGQKIWEFTGHTDYVRALAVGPDGSIYSGGLDKKIFKISSSGQKIWEFTGHDRDVMALAVGLDGSIYSCDYGRKIFKISTGGNKIWEFTGNTDSVLALAVGPDGSIYSGSEDGKVFKISEGNYTTSYKIIK